MGNLGGYQWLTTVAKKVGGPKNLVLIIAGTGAVAYKSSEVLAKKVIKEIRKKFTEKKLILESDIQVYVVTTPIAINEDLAFENGEHFKVLESDGDAVLIEKIGDANNPYFVSADLLKKISDYND